MDHNLHYVSDFRYESNRIFVLGVGFFFRQISTFQLAIFDGIFLYHSKVIVVQSLKLKIYFTYDHGLVGKLRGFKGCHSGQFGTIYARYISCYQRVSGD